MSETTREANLGDRQSPNHPRRAHILLADDQPELRDCISRCLSRVGYDVTTVADGQQAWQALQSAPYDLLITDQQMPGLTGAELILRARLRGLALPIVVIGSDPSFFNASRCQWLGITAVLPKPFGVEEFLQTVTQALCAETNGAARHQDCSGLPHDGNSHRFS